MAKNKIMKLLPIHAKSAIQAVLLLSSFTGSEQVNVKDTTTTTTFSTTLQSLYDPSLGTEAFQCQDVSPKILKHKINRLKYSKGCNNRTNVTKCRRSCTNDSNCLGYFFDKDESTCTTYLSVSQSVLPNSSTQYCAKTSDIFDNDTKYSCVNGNKWSTKVDSDLKCFKKCEKSKACYGFAYDRKRKICDRFMRERAKPSQMRSNGSRCDEVSRMMGDSAPKCPCFNANDIDGVVSDFVEKKAKVDIEIPSCEIYGDDELYGLNYRYDTIASETNLSFSVSGANANGKEFCVMDESTKFVTTEEKGQCLKLLQGGCKTLQDKNVDLGRCPCFDEEKLAVAVKQILNGSKVVVEGFCTSNAAGNSIDFFYEDPSNSWPAIEGYSIYVSSILDSKRCTLKGDMVVPDISGKSASDCFSLIQNACKQILHSDDTRMKQIFHSDATRTNIV